MMKSWLRNSLSLLLAGTIFFSALPVGAAGTGTDDETTQFPAGEQPPIVIDPSGDETPIIPVNPGQSASKVLYSWTASDLNRDAKAFSSNLPDDSDPRQRWNESAQIYTAQGSRQIVLHSFLNEAEDTYGLKTTKDFAGRTAVENLQVDVYPMAQVSDDVKFVSLSFVYAHKLAENGLNPANSGFLQVYVSADGVNWSKDFAEVRSAQIVGSGIDQDGEDVIYYEVFTKNLNEIANGDDINVLRILPDGNSGMCGGSFSLHSLTLNGYKTESAFNKAVPQETEGAAADRNAVLTAYKGATGDGLARAQAAMALVLRDEVKDIPEMLDTIGLRFADGVAVKATADVREIFDWMLNKKLQDEKSVQSILNEYEHITNTEKVIKDLNRPQQIFKAYASCDVGDLLVQVKKDGTSNVYMVAKKVNVLPDNAGNINIATSEITYVDNGGSQKTGKMFDLYKQGFVPMVMDALADDAVQPVRVDAHVSGVDQQVRVAVSAGQNIERIEYNVTGTSASGTVWMESPNEAKVFTSDALNQLPGGTYEMELEVVTKLGSVKQNLAFTVSNFKDAGRSLSLTDMVYINKYIDITGFGDVDIAANGGMLTWTGKIAKNEAVVGNEKITNTSGLVKYEAVPNRYAQQTPGIWADQYAETIYIRFYVKVGDTYKYSDIQTETVQGYCEDAFRVSQNEGTKETCAALLYYGAAAQTYFDGMTSGRVDESVPEEYAYLKEWDEALIDELKPVPETDLGGSANVVSVYGKSLSLKEAIGINYYFTVDSSIEVAEAELLFWDENETRLSVETAIAKKMDLYRGNYTAQSPMIYSNEMGETVFAVAHIKANDGNDYYSDVVVYSPEQYAADIIERGKQEAMKPLVKSMVVYGNCAKELFQNQKGN